MSVVNQANLSFLSPLLGKETLHFGLYHHDDIDRLISHSAEITYGGGIWRAGTTGFGVKPRQAPTAELLLSNPHTTLWCPQAARQEGPKSEARRADRDGVLGEGTSPPARGYGER